MLLDLQCSCDDKPFKSFFLRDTFFGVVGVEARKPTRCQQWNKQTHQRFSEKHQPFIILLTEHKREVKGNEQFVRIEDVDTAICLSVTMWLHNYAVTLHSLCACMRQCIQPGVLLETNPGYPALCDPSAAAASCHHSISLLFGAEPELDVVQQVRFISGGCSCTRFYCVRVTDWVALNKK